MFVYLVTFAGLVQNLFSTTFLPMVVKVKCYGKFTNTTCVERRHFYQHTPYCRTLFIAGLFQAMAGGGVKRHELTQSTAQLNQLGPVKKEELNQPCRPNIITYYIHTHMWPQNCLVMGR